MSLHYVASNNRGRKLLHKLLYDLFHLFSIKVTQSCTEGMLCWLCNNDTYSKNNNLLGLFIVYMSL